jgi:MFS family permease
MVLGTAQFLMVLDSAVMNVSISQLVEDFETDITTIQRVITLYTLVMASFMIVGSKLGDMWGRRRSFTIGLVVYAVGSALTALAPTVWVLTLGWSVIEGLGAALVLPALAALVGGNYEGRQRATAYAVIGGLAGAGIAVGPLLGGWVTTYLTWRLVFAGEVVIVLAILMGVRWISDVAPVQARRRLDVVGAGLSVSGLILVVLGVLQSTTWGWLRPADSPITVFGFALTPFVIAAGLVLLWLLRAWERHVEKLGATPLVNWHLFEIPPLRAGLATLLAQNMILLGLFFAIPLYLQVVQGFDAFNTGLRLLPISVVMLLTSMAGPALGRLASPRTIVRVGLAMLFIATLWLVATVKPQIVDLSFGIAMGLLGIGMGLLASQLGNVVQSSVGHAERSEVGGLQYTAQNLGSSLGTAFVGSILIGALASAFLTMLGDDPAVSEQVKQRAGMRIESGVPFVPTDQARQALVDAGVPPDQVDAIVRNYADAQLVGLKIAFLTTSGIALASYPFTRHLPSAKPHRQQVSGRRDTTTSASPATKRTRPTGPGRRRG